MDRNEFHNYCPDCGGIMVVDYETTDGYEIWLCRRCGATVELLSMVGEFDNEAEPEDAGDPEDDTPVDRYEVSDLCPLI